MLCWQTPASSRAGSALLADMVPQATANTDVAKVVMGQSFVRPDAISFASDAKDRGIARFRQWQSSSFR
jgi:hypothetical protein